MWPHNVQHFFVWRHPYLLPSCTTLRSRTCLPNFLERIPGFWSLRYMGTYCALLFASLWRRCSDMICDSDGVVINCVVSWWTARSALGFLGTTLRVWVSCHITLGFLGTTLWVWVSGHITLGLLGTTLRVWVSGHITLWLHSLHFWRYFQTLLAPFDNTIQAYLFPRSWLYSASVTITAGSIAETDWLD